MDDTTYTAAAEAAMPGMFRMAYSILENRHDAEDAVQQALLNAWQHREKARPGAERAWMMRIVINASLDLCRKRRRAVPVAEVPEKAASSGDGEYAALRDMIRRLPQTLRTPFLLKYMEGMTEKEVGAALRIPLTSVKNRLYRARTALQKEWGREASL
ncbi:MAG: sigma-70 family RNA polymerase sigma factor [Clostridia bacterium]|nr:sigma-70 family RNA polymerase sigma factor [Clostridia bacterium]